MLSVDDSDGVLGHFVSSSCESKSSLQPRKRKNRGSRLDLHRAQRSTLDRPRLIYRWYNYESQGLNTVCEIRAGQFIEADHIPQPTWSSEALRDHLTKRKVPTPFISFRDSIRDCIRRVARSYKSTDLWVAVVDTKKLLLDSIELRDSDDPLRSSQELVARRGLRAGRWGKYTGKGEWLVYGLLNANL